jgi:hypothetical protein
MALDIDVFWWACGVDNLRTCPFLLTRRYSLSLHTALSLHGMSNNAKGSSSRAADYSVETYDDAETDSVLSARDRSNTFEYLYPPPMSAEREGSIGSGAFALISTITGGGILSLPYAIMKVRTVTHVCMCTCEYVFIYMY